MKRFKKPMALSLAAATAFVQLGGCQTGEKAPTVRGAVSAGAVAINPMERPGSVASLGNKAFIPAPGRTAAALPPWASEALVISSLPPLESPQQTFSNSDIAQAAFTPEPSQPTALPPQAFQISDPALAGAISARRTHDLPADMPRDSQARVEMPQLSAGKLLPLDLASALRMTEGDNPRVAFVQAQASQAYAQYQAAKVLWLPSLRAGMNYNKHEGRVQDVIGDNIETSRGAAYGGLGASAVGAGSPAVPGIYAQFHLADAIYQPQIRAHTLSARQFESEAARNDHLLATALAYVDLLSARQRQAIAQETFQHGDLLARTTAAFARTGAGNGADADRAAAAVSLLQNEVLRSAEEVSTASARLAELLSLDPDLLVDPQEPTITPISLVQPNQQRGELVATGLQNRPELAASRSLVCEAVNRLNREERAPWLPSVLLGMSYGSFGAGTGGDITNGGDRFDFDAAAWWEVRNLGFGEQAARDGARAQIRQAQMREVQVLDRVAREVVEAHAQVEHRRLQIAAAQQALTAAQRSYERNVERIRNAQGLPIEVLQSIQGLDTAQREFVRVIADFNSAQFRLHRALGWPIE